MHTLWSEDMTERHQLGELDTDGWIKARLVLKKRCKFVGWILIPQGGGQLLWTRYWTAGLHKRQGNSWPAERIYRKKCSHKEWCDVGRHGPRFTLAEQHRCFLSGSTPCSAGAFFLEWLLKCSCVRAHRNEGV